MQESLCPCSSLVIWVRAGFGNHWPVSSEIRLINFQQRRVLVSKGQGQLALTVGKASLVIEKVKAWGVFSIARA